LNKDSLDWKCTEWSARNLCSLLER